MAARTKPASAGWGRVLRAAASLLALAPLAAGACADTLIPTLDQRAAAGALPEPGIRHWRRTAVGAAPNPGPAIETRRRILGRIQAPESRYITRMEFVGNRLEIAYGGEHRRVELWSCNPLRKTATLPGDHVVAYAARPMTDDG